MGAISLPEIVSLWGTYDEWLTNIYKCILDIGGFRWKFCIYRPTNEMMIFRSYFWHCLKTPARPEIVAFSNRHVDFDDFRELLPNIYEFAVRFPMIQL